MPEIIELIVLFFKIVWNKDHSRVNLSLNLRPREEGREKGGIGIWIFETVYKNEDRIKEVK